MKDTEMAFACVGLDMCSQREQFSSFTSHRSHSSGGVTAATCHPRQLLERTNELILHMKTKVHL